MTDAEFDQLRGVEVLRAIIADRVELERDGRRWKGRCPFHSEKTASFKVFPDGKFKCFGCGARGDVFDYVQRRDGVDFPQAAEIVASAWGITPKPEKKRDGNGKYRDGDWFPMVPPPPEAPKPDARLLGRIWFDYVDRDGKLLFYQRRFEKADGKSFAQLTYGTLTKQGRAVTGWHGKGPPQPFPLYRLDRLMLADPSSDVIVVEGEGKCQATEHLFPDKVVTSWLNGAGSIHLTDWSPLKRFPEDRIIWWPDADVPRPDGKPHGCFLATPAFHKLFPRARFVDTTGLEAIKDGFDAADLSCDDPDAWLAARLKTAPRESDAPNPVDCLPFRWGASLAPVLDTQDFVEDLLTTACLAVDYGDSNVGKSFWVIDLGLHIAGGIPWNGREVEQGIVILVALEGGRSIDNRIIAARSRLGLPPTVPIVVVQCPIDLRTNSVDAERLTNTIKLAISQCAGPIPVRLIIIDTMSRALNGGSENAEDMSALLANADRIRHETGVAIMFVAHCGKDAARGIRGWSGIRAAIDVEIETTRLADDGGFVAEVTKERDLPIGDRFGFKLDVVEMGRNPRGKPVTTCVVVPADAPAKKKSDSRMSKMNDTHAAMWGHVRDLMGRYGALIRPTLDMPLVTGMTRILLRESLIPRGWYDEGKLLQDGKVAKTGLTDENNALSALKRRGFLEFNRKFVWLL